MPNINGRNIDCVESGEGPAVLFLPGSYSTPAAWRPVQRLLGLGRRLVTALMRRPSHPNIWQQQGRPELPFD